MSSYESYGPCNPKFWHNNILLFYVSHLPYLFVCLRIILDSLLAVYFHLVLDLPTNVVPGSSLIVVPVKPLRKFVPYINERVFYSERTFIALYYYTCRPFSLNRKSVNLEHWPIHGGCLKYTTRRPPRR